MKNQNGTPATTETPREQYLSECLTERREVLAKTRKEVFALQCANDALTAKAAALDALVEAAMVLVQHAQEAYPHFEYTRGQADIAATLAALSAAKAAQVSK